MSASATSSAGSLTVSAGLDVLHGDGGAGAQPVEAQPGGHGRQPGRQAVDLGVRPVQPQPRLLHDVLGLGVVAEHPARDRDQAWSFSLEHVRLVHGLHPSTSAPHPPDARAGPGVTALGERARGRPSFRLLL